MSPAPDRPTSRWHRVDGVAVHSTRQAPVDATGGVAEIVLVPGLGMSGRTLRPLARALARRAPVRVVDLPGAGPRPHRHGDPGVEDLAATLVAWLRAVGVVRPLLVGVSLGCQVVVEAARSAPHAASGVVLVSPPFDRRARGPWRQLLRMLATFPRERPGVIALIGLDWLRAGPGRVARLARAGAAYRVEDRVADVGAPVLVVRGDADPVAPPAWADEVARSAPRGRVTVVAGAGHGMHWRTPERLAQAVLAFAARRGGVAPAVLRDVVRDDAPRRVTRGRGDGARR